MYDNQPPSESSSRRVIIAFVFIALALVGAGAVLLLTRPAPVRITINPPQPTATPQPTNTPGPITVYVTGAVRQPQTTISLPAGSRVQDALDAAGGASADADLDRVNLAQVLRDGDQVHVPERGATSSPALPTANTTGLVRINSATSEELVTLPGIGPALAQRIIAYREANGPFDNLETLDNVEGIGPAMIESLKGLILFD